MVGNAHEWVKEQKIVGGGFDSGPDVATCRYSSPKAPGSSSGNIGFRCCARPD
jgi:formylglycine-generating enzyme required for sulfatase activity